jgi:hypothetical protein
MRRDISRVRALNCLLHDNFVIKENKSKLSVFEESGINYGHDQWYDFISENYIDWKRVSEATDAELLCIPNFGGKSLMYIQKVLRQKGYETAPVPAKRKPHYQKLGRIFCPHCGEHINLHTYHS